MKRLLICIALLVLAVSGTGQQRNTRTKNRSKPKPEPVVQQEVHTYPFTASVSSKHRHYDSSAHITTESGSVSVYCNSYGSTLDCDDSSGPTFVTFSDTGKTLPCCATFRLIDSESYTDIDSGKDYRVWIGGVPGLTFHYRRDEMPDPEFLVSPYPVESCFMTVNVHYEEVDYGLGPRYEYDTEERLKENWREIPRCAAHAVKIFCVPAGLYRVSEAKVLAAMKTRGDMMGYKWVSTKPSWDGEQQIERCYRYSEDLE